MLSRNPARKATILISRVERDCHENIGRLIDSARGVAALWAVDWDADCWDVREVFAHTLRSHRTERRAWRFWFTERGERAKTPGKPFARPFGDVVRSLVVLRHQTGNQCFGDQQQIIIACRYIYAQLAGRDYDLVTLTPGDLDRACQMIVSGNKETTAYKLVRFVEEIAATFDQNRVCRARLTFRYGKKRRPSSVDGIGSARIDAPDFDASTSSKVIPDDVLGALGRLYQVIPLDAQSDRLLINLAVLAVFTGRRIGELLTMPDQQVRFDRKGHAYLRFYAEKRSQGSQSISLQTVYLIPQTVPLLQRVISEVRQITRAPRDAARRMAASGGPDLAGFPPQEFLTARELANTLGLSDRPAANGWLRTRKVQPAHQRRDTAHYRREDIIDGMRRDLFCGPAVHVTPPGADLQLDKLMFIAHKYAFHSARATFRYAVWPVNVQHVSDFLGARTGGVFERYLTECEQAHIQIRSHSFRHTLNTLLERGGLSDVLQTEWFQRKNPADTKAYQHMSAEEKAYAARRVIRGMHQRQELPAPRFSSHADAAAAAVKAPVLDIGPGWCQHDWLSPPCPRHLETPVAAEALSWVPHNASCRKHELTRMREITRSALDTTDRCSRNKQTDLSSWKSHLTQRLHDIQAATTKHDQTTNPSIKQHRADRGGRK